MRNNNKNAFIIIKYTFWHCDNIQEVQHNQHYNQFKVNIAQEGLL